MVCCPSTKGDEFGRADVRNPRHNPGKGGLAQVELQGPADGFGAELHPPHPEHLPAVIEAAERTVPDPVGDFNVHFGISGPDPDARA